MDVDDRDCDVVDEVLGEDLHVPREDDEVDVAREQLHDLGFGSRLVRTLGGHVEERDAEASDVLGHVGVIGDHHRDRYGELAAAVTPQQIEKTVVRG